MDDRGIARAKAFVATVGLLTASIGGAFALGVIGAPSVVGVENRFGDVNDNRTIIRTDLVLNNPNPIGVRLGGSTVNYTVRMNDVEMATGSKAGLEVQTGNSTLDFETAMFNDRIPPWWVSHIRNDERTNVTIDATVRTSLLGNQSFDIDQRKQVETDIISAFASDETRPVNAPDSSLGGGLVYSNPVLFVNRTSAEWGQVTQQETPIPMEFTVYNPNTKPYTISEVGYTITMNNITMGEGATEETYVVEGRTTETLRTAPTIRNGRLDEWWVSHLQNDQTTRLRIEFYAKIELDAIDKDIRVPLDRLDYTREFETDIFGTKNATGNATGTAATPTGTPTATPTPESATGGLTGTDSPTAVPDDSTPPGTATPTDDGLVALARPGQ
jgi:LEA14-like dessication related protein